jgi:hypothetical protein
MVFQDLTLRPCGTGVRLVRRASAYDAQSAPSIGTSYCGRRAYVFPVGANYERDWMRQGGKGDTAVQRRNAHGGVP